MSGIAFRNLLKQNELLVLPGVINALTAKIAKQSNIKAIYLSGAGVANASFGLPDLGITSLNDVAEETRRITAACDLPLIVDADVGWGSVLNIAKTVRDLEQAGAAGLHLEDQEFPKRCGHRENKSIVTMQVMVDRLKAAVDAKKNQDFVIIARTDALALESIEDVESRVAEYINAGAEVLFLEAVTDLKQYQHFSKVFPQIPILANITEFGKTPLWTKQQLKASGVKIMLLPLTAFRAINKTAEFIYQHLAVNETQSSLLNKLQTREELYKLLDYYNYESLISNRKI